MHPLSTLKDDVDRAFQSAFRGWPGFGSLSEWDPFKDMEPMFGRLASRRLPHTDVEESGKSYVVSMELAGVGEEDLDLTITENMMTVKGEKKSEREEKEKDYHLTERSYGRFERSFRLPDEVNADKAKAEFKNGVLKVTLPKRPAAKKKTRKIDVKTK